MCIRDRLQRSEIKSQQSATESCNNRYIPDRDMTFVPTFLQYYMRRMKHKNYFDLRVPKERLKSGLSRSNS